MEIRTMSIFEFMEVRRMACMAMTADGEYKVVRCIDGIFEVCELPTDNKISPFDLEVSEKCSDLSEVSIDESTLHPVYAYNIDGEIKYGYCRYDAERNGFINLV